MPEKVYSIMDILNDLLRSEIKGYSPDNLKEVLSIIAYHVRKDGEPTPLEIKNIKRLVPQGDKYLKGLYDLEIIKRSGHSIKGQLSYKYIFAPDYKSKYITLPLNNAKLIRRIEIVWAKLRKEAVKSVRGHSEQVKFLRRLSIDLKALRFIDKNFVSDTHKYNCAKASIIRIQNRDIFYSIDSTSKRFHSNLTNISKELRPFLRINDESLVNIDIKNSQPYLSTIILTNPGKVSWMTENPVFALLLQTLKVSLKEDVKNYINFVISGQLYEYLMQEFEREGMLLTREVTKIQVLRILFARNRMPKDETNRKARQIFKNRFPTVHRLFSKVRGSERGDKFHNFKRFAILLQRIESYLILEVILKRIYKELPGTIAVTIHDSVMTGVLTNNTEAVRRIMREELTSFMGIPPQLKVEEYTEEEGRIENKGVPINQYDATTFVTLN